MKKNIKWKFKIALTSIWNKNFTEARIKYSTNKKKHTENNSKSNGLFYLGAAINGTGAVHSKEHGKRIRCQFLEQNANVQESISQA